MKTIIDSLGCPLIHNHLQKEGKHLKQCILPILLPFLLSSNVNLKFHEATFFFASKETEIRNKTAIIEKLA